MLNSRISPKHAKSAKTLKPRGRIVDRQAYMKIKQSLFIIRLNVTADGPRLYCFCGFCIFRRYSRIQHLFGALLSCPSAADPISLDMLVYFKDFSLKPIFTPLERSFSPKWGKSEHKWPFVLPSSILIQFYDKDSLI